MVSSLVSCLRLLDSWASLGNFWLAVSSALFYRLNYIVIYFITKISYPLCIRITTSSLPRGNFCMSPQSFSNRSSPAQVLFCSSALSRGFAQGHGKKQVG